MSFAAQKASTEPLESPISNETLKQLHTLVSGFERDQLIWTSGYLAALAQEAQAATGPFASPDGNASPDRLWTIFFATETGNSRNVAESLHRRSGEFGIQTRLQDLREFRAHRLEKIERALFVVSTHGLGDPPEGTQAFFDHLMGDEATNLPKLQYAVLALGDSSYADFCETGKQLDARLQYLGAKPIIERVDCDLNFRPAAEKWSLSALQEAEKISRVPGAQIQHLHAVQGSLPSNALGVFESRVLANQRITGRSSSKEVRHLELDIEGSGFSYLPGDSLGIMPENPPEVVEQLLEALGLSGVLEVTVDSKTMNLEQALLQSREITAASGPLLKALGKAHRELEVIRNDRDKLRTLLLSHQVIDLVTSYPMKWDAQALVDTLRELPPRLYSIASSADANPGEAHLTVAVVQYERFGRPHWGSASNYMARGAKTLKVHLEPNEHFRLPAAAETPIIMIGAGTGIAPYRAFLEHRRAHAHSGDNWLIFGDRNFFSDFLYQAEWLDFRKQGYLKHLDLAFSRDGPEKVYVQHRIEQHSRRLYAWLQQGAHIYVCGDANAFADDVHAAILKVLESQAGLSAEQAWKRLAELRDSGRYQRDVY